MVVPETFVCAVTGATAHGGETPIPQPIAHRAMPSVIQDTNLLRSFGRLIRHCGFFALVERHGCIVFYDRYI
jgi:hypothetical protein